MGLGRATLIANNAPPINCVYLQFDPTTNGNSNFWIQASDGTTAATPIDTGLAWSASTTSRARAKLSPGAVSFEISTLTAGVWTVVLASTTTPNKIPADGQILSHEIQTKTLENVAKSMFFHEINFYRDSTG